MSYNDIPCADPNAPTCGHMAESTNIHLAEILRSASASSKDALVTAGRIRQFLFNVDENNSEKMPEPKCFQDELMLTRYNLNSVCVLLNELSYMLGLD